MTMAKIQEALEGRDDRADVEQMAEKLSSPTRKRVSPASPHRVQAGSLIARLLPPP
jgi:hypothetical protein